MAWDLQLFYALNNLAGQSPVTDAIIVAIASYLPYALVAGFALYLCFKRSWSVKQKLFSFSTAIAAALVARIAIGSPIRFFFPRQRPFLTNIVHQLIAEHAPSFPSGHSLFFFAFSTAVFFVNKKLGILFYALTILICMARVAAGIHYPSDIIAGAVLGILSAYIVVRVIVPRIENALRGTVL